MIKRIITLFKIGRVLAQSEALNIIYKFHKPPTVIKFIFLIFSISLKKNENKNSGLNESEILCTSIQSMGTSFIKLGQFLSTRPDIIGDDLSQKLEKLQDRVPPFENSKAKQILKENLGEENFNSILNLSEPIAAASIAQVHKAQINENGVIKDVAIKILRPDIKKKI